MIGALKSLFAADPKESEEDREHRRHLAAAALLIETARADFTQDAEELESLKRLLTGSLSLSLQEVDGLIRGAEERVDASTSLYEFTRVINDYYSAAEKLELIDAMWVVAYADGNIDKYEEHLIRRVAELTYVPHADYIRSKLQASPGGA